LWIKGKRFTLKNLLQDNALADEFEGASLVIARLAPQDYHRFHTPVDGKIKKLRNYTGQLFTVNPIAIRENVDVYTENKRVSCLIDTPQFGEVLYIAVGATMVGSISYTVFEGQNVKRGDEMGFFAFGGSTILVLFKKGTIQFDQDLLVNSNTPIETLVSMGKDPIGVALQ